MSLKTFILSALYRGGCAYGLKLQHRFAAAGIVSWECILMKTRAELFFAGSLADFLRSTG